MTRIRLAAGFAALLSAPAFAIASADHDHGHSHGHAHAHDQASARGSGFDHGADKLAATFVEAGQLSAAPAGVEDLRFSEIYASPVGPRGLELTPRAAALSGKRVRILGFMVRQGKPAPGVALLAPFALQTHEDEYGLCDDLPAATVSVVVPKYAASAVPFTPGPLLLTGRFETTPREEADGRVSHLRLILDEQDAAAAPATAPTAAAGS